VNGARLRIENRWVLNFASASYLGLSRDRRILRALVEAAQRWGMSLGTPRSLATPRLTTQLETALARLVAQDAAVVFPSTTHAALDVLPLLSAEHGALFLDDWAYSISWDGARAAQAREAHIVRFPHNDATALERALQAHRHAGKTSVVCDGVYSAGGQAAALREIVAVALAYGTLVYVDDAHGIGVLGKNPTQEMLYGFGGGGTPLHQSVHSSNIVHVGSLSKAFSVPLAFVAGPSQMIAHLRARSASLVHCSPPALPTVAAALAALRVNQLDGDVRRRCLLDRVRQLRLGLAHRGIELCVNGDFPIQSLHLADSGAALSLARQLWSQGVWCLPQVEPRDNAHGSTIRFIVTAYHTPADIEEAIAVLAQNL
jgi:8-amino-7-oxononanoate synthase